MKNEIYKIDAETYKLNGARIYAMKNPFGAWQVMSNDKVVADNLSLKELQSLEQQLESALKHIRTKKVFARTSFVYSL